ncbi:unnamed protein product [Rotaria socialis]|uniref:ABC transmembrane type-1 domain-containing protein n=1 Tax=Rotaria socialis TaxID=392032 RepID=A0A820VSH8_9BILA|nr:unnamed protein product [Rotaria socialis]
MDRNQSCHLASSVANRWLGLRLEMIANLLTLFTAITAVFMRDRLTGGTVGLMITFALQITHSLNMLVRVSSDVETNIIGIIGRTGSGKSSLCLSLFRIIEPTNGTIFIDNVDIQLIGLHDLRSKITIIPQDAVIFAGTIRFNIDPFSNYSDAEIWNVLELVHLKERIRMMENAIDMETDRLIQQTIRSRFKDSTVLTIAHRLHTILDSTKILVLSNGSLQEYDEPKRVAADSNSAFAKLLSDANIHLSDIGSINLS